MDLSYICIVKAVVLNTFLLFHTMIMMMIICYDYDDDDDITLTLWPLDHITVAHPAKLRPSPITMIDRWFPPAARVCLYSFLVTK